jgi:hypothetical protein
MKSPHGSVATCYLETIVLMPVSHHDPKCKMPSAKPIPILARPVVLVEGFKRTTPIKVEVHRLLPGKSFIYPDDPAVVAVASDVPGPLPSTIPGLALEDVVALMRAVPAAHLMQEAPAALRLLPLSKATPATVKVATIT